MLPVVQQDTDVAGHALKAASPLNGRVPNGGTARRNLRRGAPGTLLLPSEESLS